MLNMQRSDTDIDHTLRVVIADEDEADRKKVLDLLRGEAGFTVEAVSSVDGLMAVLDASDVDCIIVDKSLGNESGFVTNDRVAAKYLDPPAMIMLTGSGNERVAMKTLRCGFSNYVRKQSLDSRELVTAILHATSRRNMEKMQRAEMERLSRLALRDRITGMPNRQYLDDRLSALVASGERFAKSGSKRQKKQFAVLTIDINAFRTINDRFGHAVGDLALKAFADKLKQVARASDFYGRFGGDEFLYLIESDASPEAVELACRRLVAALSFSIDLDAVGLDLSPCVGAAIYPLDGATAAELLAAADMAMQSARMTAGGYSLAGASERLHPGRLGTNGHGEPEAARGAEMIPVSAPAPETGSGSAQSSEVGSDLPSGVRGVHREADRRAGRRQRVLKRGKIVSDDGVSTIDCVIRDFSEGGARVTMEAQWAAQLRFTLLIMDTGMRHKSERRWHRGREMGIEFVD